MLSEVILYMGLPPKGESSMIDRLFFDTDCISSFLWVKQESIILKLYPGKIVLPMQVYVELSNPSIPHIGQKANRLCELGKLSIRNLGSFKGISFISRVSNFAAKWRTDIAKGTYRNITGGTTGKRDHSILNNSITVPGGSG